APATRSLPPPSTRWTAVASFSIGVLHMSRSSLAQRSRSVVSSSSAVTSSNAHGRVHHFLFSPSSFVNLSESDQPSFFSIVFALGSSTDQSLSEGVNYGGLNSNIFNLVIRYGIQYHVISHLLSLSIDPMKDM
ncbi:hypothetical protein HN51_053083, partial [Arachis hypogaea]